MVVWRPPDPLPDELAVLRLLIVSLREPWWRGVAATFIEAWSSVVIDDGSDLGGTLLHFPSDAAIVDLSQGRPGVALCARLKRSCPLPVLAVSHGTGVLHAFDAGADSVASVDASVRELLARVRALVRRFPRRVNNAVVKAGPIVFDQASSRVVVNGEDLSLRNAELAIMRALLEHPGRVVSRRDLLAAVSDWVADDRTLDSRIRRLREKTEAYDGQRRIQTVQGVGFRFLTEGDRP